MSLQYIQNYKGNLYLPRSDVFSFSAEIDDDKAWMAPSIPIAPGWSPGKMSSCSKTMHLYSFLYHMFKAKRSSNN